MYRHAVAVVTATSAALLATAAPALAEDTKREPAGQCSIRDVLSINGSPPSPLAGTVTAEDIRGLMDTIVTGSRLQGFFSAGAGAPAVPAVPYIAPLVPYAMPWDAQHAVPYGPQAALPGQLRQIMAGQPQHALPDQPLNAATYQPGTGGASPGQPGYWGASPGQPGYWGPSPSAAPSSSVSAAPSASVSASAAPSASVSAAPSTSASTVPSPLASLAPRLGTSPLSAGGAPVSPARDMFEDLIGRVLVCGNATAILGKEVSSMPDTDTGEVAQHLETLVTNLPASCVTAGSPSAGAAGPAEGRATLLDVIGVSQILSTLTTYPALCAGSASTGGPSTSLLDSIGVTSLFEELAG
jgi:hypothetical protein